MSEPHGITPAAPPALEQFAYELSLYLPAPPPRVWAAFTLDIDHWWSYRLRDRTRCIIEPQVGGRWMQEWDNGGALFGNFTVWDPPKLLCVTGPLAMTRPAYNLLEFQFDAADTGTQVTIRHEAFGTFEADTAEMYANGWRELIGRSLHAYVSR
jgi:uncharacterized protein YndB with AHSA1/START domain